MNTRFYIRPSLLTCLAVLLLVLFTESACNKKLSKYNPDFIGTWRTAVIEDSTINLTVRSEIVIEKRDGLFNNTCTDECGERLCECISQQGGRAVINTDHTRLKIGSSSSSSLSIDKEPYQDSTGQWVMKIQGLTYYRQ
ncbi:MAG: hypothetical protein QE487_01890 [Fluviicola sp.]|nr:hypothetical protein [Fluviicola sp.]